MGTPHHGSWYKALLEQTMVYHCEAKTRLESFTETKSLELDSRGAILKSCCSV